MNVLLAILKANPELISLIIDPLIKALVEELAKNPDFLAKFIQSIIDLVNAQIKKG